MDLLRIETTDGPCYVDARALLLLSPSADRDTSTDIQVVFGRTAILNKIVGGMDVDEFAAALERCFDGCRIHRVT